jgi:hypothetical protein
MSTNQELQQHSARSVSGTALDYNSDFLAMFAAGGISTGTFNERFLLWINAQLGTSYTALNDAMNAFAITQGAMNWSSMGAFSIAAGTTDALILEDGAGGILLESGDYILLES